MRKLLPADFALLWPRAPRATLDGILATQDESFGRHGIDSPLRLAHFMAQVSHESGAGTATTEDLNYAAPVLRRQWPARFTPEQAVRHGRTAGHPADPRMIANLAYGGRMGNAPLPSDDGFDYRGRGLLQVTGRANYARLGRLCGIDLVGDPDRIVDPRYALLAATAHFQASGCLPHCDADALLAVSGLVNCGRPVSDPSKVNGFAARRSWLARWRARLGV